MRTGRATCPFVGALIDEVRTGLQATAIVLTTTCDQMRYAAAALEQDGELPVFLLNVPSTWQTAAAQQLYRDELERLGRFLVRIGGAAPSPKQLADVMIEHDDARASLPLAGTVLTARQFAHALADLRSSRPVHFQNDTDESGATGVSPVPSGATGVSPVPQSQHGQDVRSASRFTNDAPRIREKDDKTQSGVPLAIVGGPLLEKDLRILDLIEQAGGRVVLDATEGGERTLPDAFDRGRLADDPLAELARAYFGTIPDVFRRPNDSLFDWLGTAMSQRQAQGLLFHRYVWCDVWHAELPRVKERSSVPVLEIDECDDDASLSRTGGRIEAFLELLR